MNHEQKNHGQPAIDQTRLDRMVDGELSRSEQRALLEQIEGQSSEWPSDDWRRLALAYIEAQSFSSEFGAILQDEHSPIDPQPMQIETSGSRSRQTLAACDNADLQTLAGSATANRPNPFGVGRLTAMAVALLLAFGLGVMSSPDSSKDQPDGGHLVEHQQTPNPIEPAQKQERPNDDPENDVHPNDHPTRRPYLKLALDGESSPIAVPIFNVNEVSRDWVESEPMAIPAYIRDELVRRGHRVQQRRRLIPVQLENGQQVMIPVDEAEVQFVDHRTYQ